MISFITITIKIIFIIFIYILFIIIIIFFDKKIELILLQLLIIFNILI